jgi:hypothetical protein
MANKATQRARRSTKQGVPGGGGDGLLDVTVVLLEEGYASTAITPSKSFTPQASCGIGSMAMLYNRDSGCGPHRSMGGK